MPATLCGALVFGTNQGILNATFSANAEAIRHEIGTVSGLECDCEAVLRATKQISISSDSIANGKVIAVSAPGFPGVVVANAILSSREVTYSREAFVQDSATYELVDQPECGAPDVPYSPADPGTCPTGWSTLGALVNGTYSENYETLRHEDVYGDGVNSPLLQTNLIYILRKRITINATIDCDPMSWNGFQVISGGGSTFAEAIGARGTVTLSDATGARTNTATGIITSIDMTQNREGFASYTITIESQECGTAACS